MLNTYLVAEIRTLKHSIWHEEVLCALFLPNGNIDESTKLAPMHVDSTSSEWSSSGQSNSLSEHKMNFSETPSQSFPPFSGLGFVQDLWYLKKKSNNLSKNYVKTVKNLFDTRSLEPDRHEHSDQSENSVQFPSITLGMVRDALRLGNASFITLSLFIFRAHTPLLHH